MSFIDFPLPNIDRPRLGTFVVVALDPVSSLAALRDPLVAEAASRIKPGKRLAMAEFALGAPVGTTYRQFFPVGSGLPNDRWACIPVSPEIDHPEGRGALGVSKPLPIHKPYIHTLEVFEGIISRIYTDSPTDIQCTDADQMRVYGQHLDDMARMEAAEYGGRELSTPSLIDEDEVFVVPFPETFMGPCYHIWLEVSADETFADPRTHRDEIDALLAIEAEWRERREPECSARVLQWRESHGEYDDWEEDEKNTLLSDRESSPEPPVCATHESEQDGRYSYQRSEEQSELSFAHLSNVSIGLRDRDGSASCSEPPSVQSKKNDDDVSSESAPRVTAYEATRSPSDGRPQDSNRTTDDDDWFLAYGRVKSSIGDCFRAFMPAQAW